jgi:hypothetical protein
LRDELDTRLLPAANEQAPNLAVYLEQISHQLRLLAQKRPTFDLSILGLAMQAAWQLLEAAESDNSPNLQLAARRAIASRPQVSAQPQEITGPPAEVSLSSIPAQQAYAGIFVSIKDVEVGFRKPGGFGKDPAGYTMVRAAGANWPSARC